VYKLDSFVGFIGDEQLHAQECGVARGSRQSGFGPTTLGPPD
jgi:hypothetical protein